MRFGRTDWLPLVLVALVVGVTTWVQTSRFYRREIGALTFRLSADELEPLAAKYGPGHYSRDAEEWLIRDFFQDKRNGVFLDVGANHFQNDSNTYYLESVLGWSGVAVEALSEFGPDYARFRPRTQFVAMFASDTEGGSVKFFVPTDQEAKLVASASKSLPEREGHSTSETTVPTTTLNAVLAKAGITGLDFVSMDIELAEPKALAGFDLERYRPALVCIEAHPDVRQQLLDYFAARGYVVVGKYLRADGKNLYFRPKDRVESGGS